MIETEQQAQVIKMINSWLEQIVIDKNFCPFAKHSVEQKAVHFISTDLTQRKALLSLFADECIRLNNEAQLDTTLIILERGFEVFYDYLDLLDDCQALLEDTGFEGVYQLASFHPDYCFADCDENDAANFTNRAPLPIIQILREASVEKALRHFKSPEQIPEDNMAYCREKGAAYMAALLEACEK
jgi:hypothetical protein